MSVSEINKGTLSPVGRPKTRSAYARPTWAGVLLLWAIAALLLIGGLAFLEREPVILIAFALFGAIGVLIAARQGLLPFRLFVLVYCSSAIATVVIYLLYMNRYGTPYYVGGSDDLAYETWARDAASSLGLFDYTSIRGAIAGLWHNSIGYVYLVSLLYRFGELLGGFHTMLPRLFNAMCLGLLAVFTYRLARRSGVAQRAATWSGLFVGLLPIMAHTSAHTFRDILTSLLSVLVVYVWSPLPEGDTESSRSWRWIVTLLLLIALGELRRFQAVAILAVVFLGAVWPARRSRRVPRWLYGLIFVILAVIGLFLLRANVAGLTRQLVQTQGRYTEYRASMSDGLGFYVFRAPPPLGYVLRAGYALISPLPVWSQQIERLWLSAGTLVQYMFLPFLVLGIIQSIRDPTKRNVLVAFLLLFGGAAFVSFTIRHIVQFLPYAAILATVGFGRYKRYRVPIWFWIGWLGFGLLVAYAALKL